MKAILFSGISIPFSTIKRAEGRAEACQKVWFQFHLVRLKDISTEDRNEEPDISIPFSTIKRGRIGKEELGKVDFNSI